MINANSPFNSTFSGLKQRLSLKCLIFSGLVAAMVYFFVITGGNFIFLMLVQGVFVLWLASSIFFSKGRFLFSALNSYILLILALVFFSNLYINHGNYEEVNGGFAFALAHVFGVLFFIFAAQWAASNLQLENLLGYISLMLAPLILSALYVGLIDFEKSRSIPFGLHPNWWGEVAFGFVLCSLVLKRFLLKAFFIGIGIGLMISVQSRGALLAVLVLFLAYFIMQFRPLGEASIKRLLILSVVFPGLFDYFFCYRVTV